MKRCTGRKDGGRKAIIEALARVVTLLTALTAVGGTPAFGRSHPNPRDLIERGPGHDLLIPSSSRRGQAALDADGIKGSRILHFFTDQGVVDIPIRITSPSFGAWVADGGDFTFYPGTGNPDGTFVIPGVTAKTYYLKFGSIYVVSSQRILDLGSYFQGRPNANIASPGTVLRVNLSNMSPWQSDFDDLQMISSNAGEWLGTIAYGDIEQHYPADGDTTLDARLDYSFQPLIDSTQGDQTTIFQLATRPGVAGTVYSSVAKAFSTSNLTIMDGTQTDFVAPLIDVPLDQLWTRTIDYPSFHAYRSAIHPFAFFSSDTVYLDALPAGNGYGFYSGIYPDLVEMGTSGEVTSPEEFSLSYGNPFPWRETFTQVYAFVLAPYQLPGAQFTFLSSAIGTTDDSSNFPEPFRVQLSPPRNFRINGQPASGDLSNISVTPRLTWDAPEIGVASYHQISVSELYVDGTRTRSRSVATLYTADSELVILPGILNLGRTYVFRVIAHNNPGTDIGSAPFLLSFPDSTAPVFSGIASP